MKTFQTYVKREIVHHSTLKHPFIVSLKEVSALAVSAPAPPPPLQRRVWQYPNTPGLLEILRDSWFSHCS